jgi:hypothetical protein
MIKFGVLRADADEISLKTLRFAEVRQDLLCWRTSGQTQNIAGHAKRPMPDARRPQHGATNRKGKGQYQSITHETRAL